LELAQISSNNRDYKQAISYYEKVIDHSPQTSEAQDALNGMESIYQMQNNPTKFIAYLDKMGLSNIKSEDEKEMMVFNAAEQIFLSGKGSQAISALNNYLNTYPQGVKRGYAQYYIGKALKELGRNELAMEAYSAAIEDGDMGYMQDATADYADILYLLARYNEAVEAYDKLIYVSTSDDIRNKGMLGKIKSYFGSRQYYKAVKEASKMEEIININPEAIREANFYAAKSYMVLGERDVAKRMLVELAKNPSDAIGAESAFLMIQDYYDIGDFVNVENNVYSFSEKSTDNMYWLAKSFIVLGDSFADRDEWEQAKATYMSIKDSYTPQGTSDDVLEQVEMRLNKIEKMDLTQMSVSNENKE
jgi:TolA-binding protein